MTTADVPRASTTAEPGGRHAAVPDAASRGGLRFDDRALRRVAEQAAAEIAGRADRPSGLDALGGRALPRASVEVIGRHVRVAIQAPASGHRDLPSLASDVRRRVSERVDEFSGLTTDIVDVRITRLTGAGAGSDGEEAVPLPAAGPPARPGVVRRIGILLALVTLGLGAAAIYDALVGLGAVSADQLSVSLLEWVDGLSVETWMVPVGAVLALVGLWFVVAALLRRPRRVLPVQSQAGVYASRSAIEGLVTDTATQHPGVVRVQAVARPKAVTVRMQTDGEAAVGEDVRGWVRDRIARLDGSPDVRTVARARKRKP